MEMHQIRYFLAVCETMNFTRAAELCNVTQPALTRAIQKLEEELGGLLLRRERHLSHLTDLGQLMRPHLENILHQTESARSTANSFLRLERAPLTLGVMGTIGPMRFVEFINEFHHRNAGVEVCMQQAPLARLRELLLEGVIDVAVLAQPEPWGERLDAAPLYEEHFTVGFAPGHRYERLATVPFAELEGESYLSRSNCEFREHIRAIREAAGVSMRYCFRSEDEDWIQVLAAAGLGICVLPQYKPTVPGLLTRPLAAPAVTRTIWMVTVAGRRFSPAVGAFVRAARSFAWPARATVPATAGSDA
ncbi:MAG: LysR family transcriptional regulator [Alphaproteobacteria bacterium]|nr:LysR family transcriptional regulator [Alphaproteobacteria bacterium]